MSIRITIQGTTPKQFGKRIDKAVLNADLAVKELGAMTAEHMRNHITANTKRQPASGVLANAIQSHSEENRVGVGRIADLPIYWYIQNYGKKLSGDPFLPGGGKTVRGDFAGDRPNEAFQGVVGGAGVIMNHPGAFGVKAFKYIEPKNYIAKTTTWLRGIWATFMQSRIKI